MPFFRSSAKSFRIASSQIVCFPVIRILAPMLEIQRTRILCAAEQHKGVGLVGHDPEQRRIALKCGGGGDEGLGGVVGKKKKVGEITEIRSPLRVRGINVREATQYGDGCAKVVYRRVELVHRRQNGAGPLVADGQVVLPLSLSGILCEGS